MRLRTVFWLLLAGCAITVMLMVYCSAADGCSLLLVHMQPVDANKTLDLLADERWLAEAYALKAEEVQLQDAHGRRSKLVTCIYLDGSGQASLPGIRDTIVLGKRSIFPSEAASGQVLNIHSPNGQLVLLVRQPYPAIDSFKHLGFWPYPTQKENQDFAIATAILQNASMLMVRMHPRYDGNMVVQRLQNALDTQGIVITDLENLDLISRQIRLAIILMLLLCSWGLSAVAIKRFLLPIFHRRYLEVKINRAIRSIGVLLQQNATFLLIYAACLLLLVLAIAYTWLVLQRHWAVDVALLPRNFSAQAVFASIKAWFRAILLPTGSPSLFLFQLRGAAVWTGLSCMVLPFSLRMLFRKRGNR